MYFGLIWMKRKWTLSESARLRCWSCKVYVVLAINDAILYRNFYFNPQVFTDSWLLSVPPCWGSILSRGRGNVLTSKDQHYRFTVRRYSIACKLLENTLKACLLKENCRWRRQLASNASESMVIVTRCTFSLTNIWPLSYVK